jgi:Flp pilus assembly pilin Flp
VVVVSLACVSGMSSLSTAIKTAFTSASTTLSAT